MKRSGAIIVLILATVVTFGFWLVSYSTHVQWFNRSGAELPCISCGVYDGYWDYTRCRQRGEGEQQVSNTLRVAGFVVLTEHADSASLVAWSAGLHIGRLVEFDGKGGVRCLGNPNRVTVFNVVRTTVVVPCWAPFVLFAAYPTLAFIRGPVRRWHRRKRGLCIHCGYNLTGLTEPRCPECGQAVEAGNPAHGA